MNPSIDFTYFIDNFKTEELNRVQSPTRSIGGKGINAGRAAALSGADVILTGFLGGKLGRLTREYLEDEELFQVEMSEIAGETRTAITVMHDNNSHTQIVEEGPVVEEEEIFKLLAKVEQIAAKETISSILLCGTVNSDNEYIFAHMVDYIYTKISNDIPILVDISGIQLKNLLTTKGRKPTFIKPNEHELGYFLDTKIQTKDDAFNALQHEGFADIHYVIASLGENGAACKVGERFYQVSIPKIQVQSVTGSGDATVGGFAYAIEKKFDPIKAIKYAIACGMSNAQHKEAGMINKKAAIRLMEEIIVTEI